MGNVNGIEQLRSNDLHILCERFESLAICLHHSDRDMSCLAGIDVTNNAGFSHMHSAYDSAVRSVLRWN